MLEPRPRLHYSCGTHSAVCAANVAVVVGRGGGSGSGVVVVVAVVAGRPCSWAAAVLSSSQVHGLLPLRGRRAHLCKVLHFDHSLLLCIPLAIG
jgi:hypothetical protein